VVTGSPQELFDELLDELFDVDETAGEEAAGSGWLSAPLAPGSMVHAANPAIATAGSRTSRALFPNGGLFAKA
jgi:hypothetical protein